MSTVGSGKILADGTIKVTTDEVAPEHHVGAEAFFKLLTQLTGGESHREARGDSHHHQHEHTHENSVTHSH